jgi:hypothetical protein
MMLFAQGLSAATAPAASGGNDMIIALVEIPATGKIREREGAIRQALESTKIYHEVKGLVRKHYLHGENGGGGVYFFATRADAEAWFHDGWAAWMESRFGVRPTLRLYDNYLTLDNAAGEVRVDGEVVPAPWKSEAAE